jgi:hypothetical protein
MSIMLVIIWSLFASKQLKGTGDGKSYLNQNQRKSLLLKGLKI